ncbi:NAD(P)/FAD-dependent oxidoreductase [Muriicola sp. Z0-33]|uniref:NAD(P)/FAD-dependent oxidoreductase n=1 Tax=Muriicola sp. Z0-33 TaxID=2816957 RepID=UPI00223776EA|nr:FAD-dependent oxidoreductase [Muriicola sp. Z0-33]MCW5517342.1 FAD-dependent oxidoreductase [Muriicola sp. Z0-33]
MGKKVVVIGGGIVGLSCAYYLQKDGHQVTVIDKSDMKAGASYVNAGYLTPSHIIPLASPGMMAKGIKWMFNSSSPFYMKPRMDMDFIKWAWHFNTSSTKKNVERAIPLIKDINLLSKDLYTQWHQSGELGDFQLEKKGLLMLYKNPKEGQHEREVMIRAIDEGLEARQLSLEELSHLQPNLNREIQGAIHYQCDAHTSPGEIMERLIEYLKEKGVTIKSGTEVMNFNFEGDVLQGVITSDNTFTADEVVLASGSWTQNLSKKLGLNISVQPGKGYRINVHRPTPVTLPAVLMEAKVAVTPMRGFTRFAGTMELSGINHKIRQERVRAIAKAAANYYNGLTINNEEISQARCGLRPVSPDGLPYIGRTSKWNNLSIATGHAMMGWSLGPATGKLIAEIISQRPTSMALDGFNPERRF